MARENKMSSRQLDEERIFHIARTMTDSDIRSDYLDQICAGDMSLRDRVEALLDVHEKEQGILKSNDAVEPTAVHSPITETPGQQIGRYKLLQKIGEGGFGVVYMAEQSRPVRRTVAIKIIKPGMDTREVVARFEAERQALAIMDHVNIARVLDGGATESGRPYFVMELVKGVPITGYCDKNQLSTDDRLTLFTTVCHAVQHAHQKGVIHRDLKPSNVLVTLADGQPIVKVIDFGVAKAINQRLTEKTLFTAYGQMVGTPQYMSPEQAEMSCLDVDTRSDVYSLGVLLYELLTGTTPLESARLRTAGYAEMQRLIREEEPQKPSTRLSTSGKDLTIIAKHRSVTPEKLKHQIQGDLDWIVMKALEKDRNRRYESPNSLADDVVNYLKSEAVGARPPTFGYRTTKYLKRNRVAVTVAGMLVVFFSLGLLGTTSQWLAARRAAAEAKASEDRANEEARQKQAALLVAHDEADRLKSQMYVATMQWASTAWADSNLTRVLELLKKYDSDDFKELRGFEWNYLFRLCQDGLNARSIPHEVHPGRVRRIAVCDRSNKLAASYTDGKVSLWDLESGSNRLTLRDPKRSDFISKHNLWERPFADISSDGNYLAYPTDDHGAVNIRMMSNNATRTLRRLGESLIYSAAFSPNSKLLVTGHNDGQVAVWDIENDSTEPIWSDRLHQLAVRCVAFSPSGDQLATAGSDGVVKLCDSMNPAQNVVFTLEGHTEEIWSVAFSPKSNHVASGSMDNTIRIWDTKSGDLVKSISAHTDEVRAVEYSPEGSLLASGSRDNTAKLWETATYTELHVVKGHSHNVESVAFWNASDGLKLLTGSADYTIKCWSIDDLTNVVLRRPENATVLAESRNSFRSGTQQPTRLSVTDGRGGYSVEGLALSADNKFLVTRYFESPLLDVWDVQSEAWKDSVIIDVYASCAAVSAQNVLAIGGRGIVVLHDLVTGKSRKLKWENSIVTAIAFSSDGSEFAIADDNGRLASFDTSSLTFHRRFVGQDGLITSVAYCPQRHVIASAAEDGSVRLWDAQIGKQMRDIRDHADRAQCVAFSPDGRCLATGGADDVVFIYDPWEQENKEPKALKGHSDIIYQVVFSKDGRTAFTACGDRTVKIWSYKEAQERFTLNGHGSSVNTIALSNDESELFSGGRDGDIRIWRAD